MHIPASSFKAFDKVKRLNLINAIPGIRPANLIGTVSPEGITNLAIFSSVMHLGSDPALLGMILRPSDEVERHTWENVQATGFYTVNHVHQGIVQEAHYTSAKFSRHESEFAACGFTEQWLDDFAAPYVAQCRVKIGMQYREAIPIKANGTLLVIGTIEHIYLPAGGMDDDGHLHLEDLETVGVSGLDVYYGVQKIGTLPYARPGQFPEFERGGEEPPTV